MAYPDLIKVQRISDISCVYHFSDDTILTAFRPDHLHHSYSIVVDQIHKEGDSDERAKLYERKTLISAAMFHLRKL